jgi:hypothetical protein
MWSVSLCHVVEPEVLKAYMAHCHLHPGSIRVVAATQEQKPHMMSWWRLMANWACEWGRIHVEKTENSAAVD